MMKKYKGVFVWFLSTIGIALMYLDTIFLARNNQSVLAWVNLIFLFIVTLIVIISLVNRIVKK